MANANPGHGSDSDASENEGVPSTSRNNVNGTTVNTVDRYGFMGGKQYTDPETEESRRIPSDVLRRREIKWLDMFENWEKWMTKRFKKVKDRCRKGIPAALRARAWQFLCGSKFVMDHNKGRFEQYLQQQGDQKMLDEIKKDLHRQFPLHEMFSKQGGYGQEDLFLVLKAYTIHNPVEGYCQAHAPIAAVLLMHMPAEQAFWCLVSICEKYLPGYYSPGLEAIQLDGDVLFGLLKKTSPAVYKHLKKQHIEPIMYMTEWFMCIFTRNLPWACVLRIWDMFLCEGVKVMFRVALVLIKINMVGMEKLPDSGSFYDTLEKLRHIPLDSIDEDLIARESLKLSINERDMEKEHQRQVARRRKAKEKAKEKGSTKRKNKS